MSFYKTFVGLCRDRGIAPTQAAIECGLSRSAPTKWKNEPYLVPSGETLQLVSNYFGVSVGYLTGTEVDNPDLDGFPDIRMIARAGKRMTAEQRELLLRYAQFMFPEAFEGESK